MLALPGKVLGWLYENCYHQGPFAPSYSNNNRWSEVREGIRKHKTRGVKKVKENLSNDSYAYRTKCGGNRTRQSTPPPLHPCSRANGLSKVETSQVLGFALLNINFCQWTWLQLLQEQWQQMQGAKAKHNVVYQRQGWWINELCLEEIAKGK